MRQRPGSSRKRHDNSGAVSTAKTTQHPAYSSHDRKDPWLSYREAALDRDVEAASEQL